METKSFKALSIARLQGNLRGNITETWEETGGNIKETIDPKSFPHYCRPGDCWCSEKLAGANYPAGCIRHNCEYHQATQ